MANPDESALHYPLGDTLPATGDSIEVADGVRWVRMRLPFALDHINLWLLRDRIDDIDGWTIVDCGIADESTRAAWQQVFATQLDGLPVLRVIVTHMHPDHIGLAHWLCEYWSGEAAGVSTRECRLWISATDFNAARLASQSGGATGGDSAARFFALHGLRDAGSLERIRARSGYYAGLVPQVPQRFRRLMDGMVLRIGDCAWHCIDGHGHAPEHIALHCPELAWSAGTVAPERRGDSGDPQRSSVLISGDMVLPRISTNVSVFDVEPEGDPLPLYLKSIASLLRLPADTLVLPSHGKPFIGLHERIAQLHTHHEQRFAEVLEICGSQPCSAADLLPVMFRRPLDLHQTTFAMGEAVAHLHALHAAGRLRPTMGDDGVLRWRSVG